MVRYLLALTLLLCSGCALVQPRPWHSAPDQPAEASTGQTVNDEQEINFLEHLSAQLAYKLCGNRSFYIEQTANAEKLTGATVHCSATKSIHLSF